MKRILVCFALLTAAGAGAQGRFDKGDWFLGAQSTGLGLESRFHDGGSIGFNAGALGGWFFAERFAVDAVAGADYLKVRGSEGGGTFDFGAGVRYYPAGNLFARLGYNGDVPLSSGGVRSYLDAKAGYDLFLGETVFFEPAVYFEKRIGRSLFNGSRWTENVLGVSLGIGVRF
jgi:hypothetical protein